MKKFDELAMMIKEEYKKMFAEDNVTTLKEFMVVNDWDWEDVKDDIEYTITQINNEFYKKGTPISAFMFDDKSHIQIGYDAITWKEFKKMVFSDLQ